jgi:hypothetical protein
MRALLFLSLVVAAFAFTLNYEGHQALRVIPESLEQIETVKMIASLPHEVHDFAWWQEPGVNRRPIDFRVSPSFFFSVDHFFAKSSHQLYCVG